MTTSTVVDRLVHRGVIPELNLAATDWKSHTTDTMRSKAGARQKTDDLERLPCMEFDSLVIFAAIILAGR